MMKEKEERRKYALIRFVLELEGFFYAVETQIQIVLPDHVYFVRNQCFVRGALYTVCTL
jgi:hypothetical protein